MATQTGQLGQLQKATLEYVHGWVLTIPKPGNASMLLLEWLASLNQENIMIYTIRNRQDENTIEVRLIGTWEQAKAAQSYINANL